MGVANLPLLGIGCVTEPGEGKEQKEAEEE